jgi:outer membrane protein TolC
MHQVPIIVAGLLFSWLSPAVRAQTADSLTLPDAVRLALTSSIALRQAAAQVSAAEARVSQSESEYYPSVRANAEYMRIGPIPAIDFPGFGSLLLAPADNVDAHLGLRQTIFDFGRRAAGVEAGRAVVQSASDAMKTIRSATSVQAMQTFYTVMLLHRSIEVQQQQVDALNEHLRITQRRVESGSSTEFDALSTTVRVAQSNNMMLDLRKALLDQELNLRRLLGLGWDSPLLLSGSLERLEDEPGLDTLLQRAATDRPDIVNARDAVESAKRQAQLASLDDSPVLRLSAAYGLRNGYEPNLNAIRGNWTAGVQLEVPVFNGFRARAHSEETEAVRLAAEERLRDIRRTAEAEVRKASAALRFAREKIAATLLQVTEAERAVEIAVIRYDSGAGTNLDLLDAETSVSSARLQLLQARYLAVIARIQLDAAAGFYAQ